MLRTHIATCTFAALAFVSFALPGAARAEIHFGVGAGVQTPWKDTEAGPSVVGQILGSGFADHLRIGAEFEYREFDIEFLGLNNVQVNSYELRALLQLVLFPDSLSPYVGAGFGVSLLDFDDDRVEAAFTALNVDSFGVGLGGLVLVGVQLPIGKHFALFGEARAAISFELTDDFSNQIDYDNLGAATGLLGVRLRF